MNNVAAIDKIVVHPLAWNTLTDIDDVRKIDDSDAPCLEEIRAVLEKHNCLNRFGISLLHSHFHVADDEMLLETTDPAKREHWVRPVKRSELERGGIIAQPTILRFDEAGWNQHCGCAPHSNGHGHSF